MASWQTLSHARADLPMAPRAQAWEALRQRAEALLLDSDFPTLRDEDWKYTDLKPLRDHRFLPGKTVDIDLAAHVLPEAKGTRLVFVNGHFSSALSNVAALPPGVRLRPLSAAPDAAPLLGSLASPDSVDVFANLNHSRFADGAYLFVPQDVRVETPLHVVFATQGEEGSTGLCALPRLWVELERGAEVHLVEEHMGYGTYLTCPVAEVRLHPYASLTHERVQRDSLTAFHLSTLAARLDHSASYTCRILSLGAALSRQSPRVDMADEGAELELNGLALLDHDQVADTHSCIDHRKPHGTTRQLHKTIVDGRARSIFNGRIHVYPGAQQTDARQQARSLLLSELARVDAKPELEIFADDVKCAHGAAIGQLDPEELFYLQSRGLNLATARNLLTYGFAADLLSAIPVPSLRRQLRQAVMERTHADIEL